jgi:malate synthase
MAAFIPSRRDPEVNERAMAAVRADKERESGDGFDGTWVAHPDLVPLAREVFDGVLGSRPNQKDRLRPEVRVTARDLLDLAVPNGAVTEAGVRANVSVGLAYLASWLSGNGAAAINNLMEDAATAEISRSQLWQWRTHAVPLDEGSPLSPDRYAAIRDEELASLRSAAPDAPWTDAAALLDELVLSDSFAEFLTLGAYARLA